MFISKSYTNKEIYLLELTLAFHFCLWPESSSLLKGLSCLSGNGEGYSTCPATWHREFVEKLKVLYTLIGTMLGYHSVLIHDLHCNLHCLEPAKTKSWKTRNCPASPWCTRGSPAELSPCTLGLVSSADLLPCCFKLGRGFLSLQVNAVLGEEVSGKHIHMPFHWSSWTWLNKLPFLGNFPAARSCSKGVLQLLLLNLWQINKSEWNENRQGIFFTRWDPKILSKSHTYSEYFWFH